MAENGLTDEIIGATDWRECDNMAHDARRRCRPVPPPWLPKGPVCFGPFDLAAIPIGGYASYGERHPNHLNPEEALQFFGDIQGGLMVPMHWGTFAMNREPFREPPERLLTEALRRGLEERIAVLSPGQTIHW